ncbi:MAG: type II toxin-antitoxin system RelE/ParE family toxin [Methanothrix sp.]|nr:type II toxin-antitoxin system RelE/ParE family toxin [Methanothrix sp.]
MLYYYRRSQIFYKKFKKLTEKDHGLKDKFINKIGQVLDNPEIGDFKRYDLKGVQGVHVNPFVILYRISGDTIEFVNIDHHDKIYRKIKKLK